jgi:hypothetical protein
MGYCQRQVDLLNAAAMGAEDGRKAWEAEQSTLRELLEGKRLEEGSCRYSQIPGLGDGREAGI